MQVETSVSNLNAASQFESLSSILDSTASRVTKLSEKLHDDHSGSIRVREETLQERELQIIEIQKNVIKQRADLELEKKKMYELVGSADDILFNVNKRRDEDMIELDQSKSRLEKELADFASEKHALLNFLKMEKVEHSKEKDEWAAEKKRFHQILEDEKREVGQLMTILTFRSISNGLYF
jgi:hypothetical protein